MSWVMLMTCSMAVGVQQLNPLMPFRAFWAATNGAGRMIGSLTKTALKAVLVTRSLDGEVMFLAIWTSMLLMQIQSGTVDVCSAVQISTAQVSIRGTGGKSSREGPILFDYTCPAATAEDFVLPTVVLVDTPKFSTQEIAEIFRNLSEKSVYQAVIEGRLECRARFTVKRSDDGDIVAGNGFGTLGLYRCRMTVGNFLVLHVIKAE